MNHPSILVYTGGELIGDGVMKLPFIQTLRYFFPEAHITWMTGKDSTVFEKALAPLISQDLNQVISQTGVGEYWHCPSPWDTRFFDIILDTQTKVLRTWRLKQISHGCFISSTMRWWFSDKKPPTLVKPKALLDRLLQLVWALLEEERAPYHRPLSIPEELQALSDQLLPSGSPYLLLAPGAGSRVKCWPLESFIRTAQELASQGLRPVFILGPAEPEWKEALSHHLPQASFPLQETSVMDPRLTIALGQKAKAIVANDSGVGHLLSLAQRPMLSLFGPTPADKFLPKHVLMKALRSQDFNSQAISGIPVERVVQTLMNMI